MCDADGQQCPSANVIFVVELEQDMSRSEVEIVEDEERKFLYWKYKASIALVTSMHEGTSVPTAWDCLDNSSPHGDSGGHAALEEWWERRSTAHPYKTNTAVMPQCKKESVTFHRSRSPLTWIWNPVRAGEAETRATQPVSGTFHVGGAPVTDVGRPCSGLCTPLQERPMCTSLLLSLRDDRRLHGDGRKRRWNSSSNLCSKAAASSFAAVAPKDVARFPKKALTPPVGRSQSSLGRGGLSSRREYRPLEKEMGITVRRPKTLVDNRFGRLNMLQELLRMELERETFEDWQVLRDEFIRIGCKQMEEKPLRRALRHVAGKVEGRVRAAAMKFTWEREKRRQERRFQALELYTSHSETVRSGAIAR
ncbi:putative ATP-dependent DEAD/H RNA helicase [Trypanosoma rangeli]|uniref:Putative ATP-dependent DEAD/H RNA helicase n=1 Tax=Trypanosoma rangeli TaxID=5698 RepID=A0A422P269_TRYRA|nr:putative ATP-dependent DEAD/H RNA helicase [Trypanosoma rangeli]RNF11820.1 putative ATP-dependent DEAD/H RNA helicase [Trypanosoma rangeli]|eukprot:RNF11820.1 putative ATP-dependent DEAD/H RNA helicase [Trypanosoma rangeli]